MVLIHVSWDFVIRSHPLKYTYHQPRRRGWIIKVPGTYNFTKIYSSSSCNETPCPEINGRKTKSDHNMRKPRFGTVSRSTAFLPEENEAINYSNRCCGLKQPGSRGQWGAVLLDILAGKRMKNLVNLISVVLFYMGEYLASIRWILGSPVALLQLSSLENDTGWGYACNLADSN